MRLVTLTLSLLGLLFSSAAQADTVDELVRAELARSATPGIAIAMVESGHITRVQGFGIANIEHGVPVHSDTVFKTGATGMQFTAAGIMMLVEEGKIALDAPVGRYLPGAPRKWQNVTIRQLLNHTSGLPATPNGDFRTDYTDDQLLGIIAAQDINFPAGSRYRFSYAGYIVLGMVIKQVTGEHWAQFVRDRLFRPLGMRTAQGIDELAIIPNRSDGYEWRDAALRNAEWISSTANSTADGSLYLSAYDFAIWSQAMSQRRLLIAGSWEELARPGLLADGAICNGVPGWIAAQTEAGPMWWQSGSWQGFQTYALRFPQRDVTVFVLANGERANVSLLARRIAGAANPALAPHPAQPRSDGDQSVTERARALVNAMINGTANRSDYVDFAALDFREMSALVAATLQDLGPMQEFALFDRTSQCAQVDYRYRARFEKGMAEVRMGVGSNGKITNIEVLPIDDWNAPL